MHTKIKSDGSISVEKPVSKSGDKIVLEALMDIRLGILLVVFLKVCAIVERVLLLKLLLTKSAYSLLCWKIRGQAAAPPAERSQGTAAQCVPLRPACQYWKQQNKLMINGSILQECVKKSL